MQKERGVAGILAAIALAVVSLFSLTAFQSNETPQNVGGTGTIYNLPIKTFLGLTDTPSSYVGQASKVVSVKSDETGLEFTTGGGGSGTPGGSDTQIQYNNSGSFGGISGATSNGTSLTISSGNLKLTGATSGTSTLNAAAIAGTTTLTLPGATDTLVGKATTDTFTNKTFDTAGTGNLLQINGTTVNDLTGTGSKLVLQGSPTLITPNIGAAVGASLSSDAGNNLLLSATTDLELNTTSGQYLFNKGNMNASQGIFDFSGISADRTYTFPNKSGTVAMTSDITGAFALTDLSNLASVAINTDLLLGSSDGGALGSTTKQWSDLFLAEGGVINWDNGDLTLTQTGNELAVAGGVFKVPANGLTIDTTNVTSTGTQLNYLNAATGTTGTTSTNLVFSTSPTLTTPTIGVATATSINKVAITAPATSATLTIADGKTLTSSNTLTLAGTDGKGINVGAATSGKILVGDGSNMVLSTPTFPNASATTGKIIKSDGTNWVASTETYAAPGTNKNVMKSDGTNWTSAAPSFEGMVEAISFQDAGTALANSTYVLELYAEYAYTINEMRIISGAGTVTANLKIGSTSVTSCSAVSVTTTITSCTASGANTVAVGDKITLVTTSASSLDNLQATIKTTRN